ncbi:MAG: HPr family phosphocarrier protein [candidate division Zixibacteria bacterium]|jgi:phosphocarrier protein|nr:HPr family phosphocarrier protein [candidate division Zixibacteria bacterium]
MTQQTVTIVNKLGMHARPSAMFVTEATRYEAEVYVSKDGTKVNGKSIMGVMMLAAEKGAELLLEVNGPDEEAALAALVKVIASGFGEEM